MPISQLTMVESWMHLVDAETLVGLQGTGQSRDIYVTEGEIVRNNKWRDRRCSTYHSELRCQGLGHWSSSH